MNVVIIEDEKLSADRLIKMILNLDSSIIIQKVIDSVEDTICWFTKNTNTNTNLIFMDIHLADGSSFEVFNKIKITTPIIFTTAYDKYAMKAFKVNSIDYLLKPIDKNELNFAYTKFKEHQTGNNSFNTDNLKSILNQIQPNYKERFLVKSLNSIIPIKSSNIAYFYSEDKLTFLKTNENKKYLLDYTLEQLVNEISPDLFFKINRKFIVNINSLTKLNSYLNSRLKLDLSPPFSEDVIVSREKVTAFKKWMRTSK